MQDKNKKKQKKPSIGDLTKQIENISNSHRIIQMVLQQMGNSFQAMKTDLDATTKANQALVYRVKAFEEQFIDSLGDNNESKVKEAIDNRVTSMQIDDFNNASAARDKQLGFEDVDVVSDKSDIVITSYTPNEETDMGVLRSRLSISDITAEELKQDLIGKKINDKVVTDINGVKHEITLLAIKDPIPKEETEQPELQVVPNE